MTKVPIEALLELRGIVKTFPGVRALDDVDFQLQRGEIHALLGENGAGKSTLIKVLTGVYERDGGTMRLAGQEIRPRNPFEAQELGISTLFQEINLIPELSVAENLALGREPRRWGLIHHAAARKHAIAAMARLDLHIDVSLPVCSYSIAIQQMVAIARALDEQAKVLILDEPTSSLDAAEVAQLFAVLRQQRDQGLGIVFVSHFLDQIYALCDRLTILRNGKFVATSPIAAMPRMELIGKMIGKDTEQVAAMQNHLPATTQANNAPSTVGDSPPERPVILRARNLRRRNAVEQMDLEIHAGEVVGLAGLLGSGRTETAQLLFGIDIPDHGSLEVNGLAIKRPSPRAAIAQQLAFTPEDRKRAGIIPELSVRENIVLALQARRGWLRRIPHKEQQEIALRFIHALKIATPDADKAVGLLSGGNQQKVILARWLAMRPKLLILDEPTRGIDIGAKAEIENLIAELCADGMALLFISSDLEEVVRDSHRVVVLRERRKVGELHGDDIRLDRILQMIAAEPSPQPTEEPKDA